MMDDDSDLLLSSGGWAGESELGVQLGGGALMRAL
jgi:hypothetical protein